MGLESTADVLSCPVSRAYCLEQRVDGQALALRAYNSNSISSEETWEYDCGNNVESTGAILGTPFSKDNCIKWLYIHDEKRSHFSSLT